MGDIQQQVADGARPLARVGDVIAHGEAIPANVVQLRDDDDDTWARHGATFRCDPAPGSTFNLSHYWPMVVVEVDPDPQPDEDPVHYRVFDGPLTLCGIAVHKVGWTDEADIGTCQACRAAADEEPADALDADGYLPLKGTATGDNQLDVPQPALGVAWLREAIQCWMPDQWREQAVAVLLELDAPAESGPVVLSLPQVPDGAVALIGKSTGWRYVRWPNTNHWHSYDPEGGTDPGNFGDLLWAEDSVTVEFAPPREPRTWPKLDAAPDIDDLPTAVDLIERDRSPLRFVLTTGLRGVLRYIEPGHPDCSFTLAELRTLGEVREVLS